MNGSKELHNKEVPAFQSFVSKRFGDPSVCVDDGLPACASDRIGAGGSRLAEGFAPVSVDRNVHQFWQ